MSRHCFVTGDFPPRPGGQARFLEALWGGLCPELGVIVAPGGEAHGSAESPRGVVRRPIPTGSSLAARGLRTSLLALHALRWSAAHGAAAVHGGQVMAGGLAAWACRRALGIPYTVVAHGADLLEFERGAASGRLAARVLREAARIVVNSRFTRHQVLRMGVPDKKVRIIHPPVPAERFYCAAVPSTWRRRLGERAGPVLLTVGRLVPRKGHDTLLEAVARLRRAFPDLRLLVVGEGPEQPRLDRLARELDIRDRVVFAGHVPDGELAGCYAAADLFVMLPRHRSGAGDVEGFGIVYVEAGAAGLAVVGTETGGVPDAVKHGETGVLVPPDEPEAAARAITHLLLDTTLRRRMGEAGRRRAEWEFSPVAARGRLLEVLDEIAQDR